MKKIFFFCKFHVFQSKLTLEFCQKGWSFYFRNSLKNILNNETNLFELTITEKVGKKELN